MTTAYLPECLLLSMRVAFAQSRAELYETYARLCVASIGSFHRYWEERWPAPPHRFHGGVWV